MCAPVSALSFLKSTSDLDRSRDANSTWTGTQCLRVIRRSSAAPSLRSGSDVRLPNTPENRCHTRRQSQAYNQVGPRLGWQDMSLLGTAHAILRTTTVGIIHSLFETSRWQTCHGLSFIPGNIVCRRLHWSGHQHASPYRARRRRSCSSACKARGIPATNSPPPFSLLNPRFRPSDSTQFLRRDISTLDGAG